MGVRQQRGLSQLGRRGAQQLRERRLRLDATGRALERQRLRELAPFRQRMAPDAYAQSRQRCVDRLLREQLRLPIITFE